MIEQTKGNLTRESIKKALLRITRGTPKIIETNRKVSIAAVAEEAGVSRATIHNNYPELAEKIRELNNKTARIQHGEKNKELQQEKIKNKILRGEIRQLNLDLTKLASINASILIENKKLTAINSSKNVVLMEK